MNSSNKAWLMAAAGLILGVVGTLALMKGTGETGGESGAGVGAGEDEPLYWVAPMDPNYRRDKPGKSPMGMDLIPVYEEGADAPGTVQISPEVVNNLGVRTAAVTRETLAPAITTVGYVQYDEHQLVNVDPRVEGWIETLHVKAEGDWVAKGAPLYTLYSPTLVNAQEELVLALKQGDQRLVKGAVERLKALRVPQSAIQQLQESRAVRQTVTINSPQDGFVDELDVREGAYVTPGSRIMSIAGLDSVWVIGEIFERQLPFVEVGDRVTMAADYLPGREWQGQVTHLYPTVDSATRTVQVRTQLANPGYVLKPGMFGQLNITGGRQADPVVTIPREALIRTGDATRVVLAQGDGKYKSIAVSVGRIVGRQVEILSGLQAGEQVVTSAQFLIDSESSKTSDFARMSGGDTSDPVLDDMVWVKAEVKAVMAHHRMVTLYHEPIEQWQWPAMTMDFSVADGVDLSHLPAGAVLEVRVARLDDGSYSVTDTRPIPAENGAGGTPANGATQLNKNTTQHNHSDAKTGQPMMMGGGMQHD